MGVGSQLKLDYSTKYINAEITDAGDRIHVVHIRYTMGDYFLTKIEGQYYVFKITGRIKTHHGLGIRTIRKLYYDTTHFLPISPADYKLIEKILTVNSLPKMNRPLFDVLRYLGKRERKDFEEHDIATLFEAVAEQESKYAKEAENMKNFLKHLNIDKIVTPVRAMTEFVYDDLITSDSKFFGDVLENFKRVDIEDKKVTNTPVRGKKPWMKIIAIVALIGLVVAIAYLAWSSGMLNSITNPFGTMTAPKAPDLMSQYGSPEALKSAIDQGKVNYDTLPPAIKKMVDTVKLPTVTPQP